MPKPTKAEMIEELLRLSEYDYAMATHGDGPLIRADIAALVCMSVDNDHCLKELGDQALAPFEAGTLAAAVIGQENAREAAAALGYGERFDELFADQKLAFEEDIETLRARNRELEQMSANEVANVHSRAIEAKETRLKEERLAEEERRRDAEERERLEEEALRLAEEERQRFYNAEDRFADLDKFASMPCWTKEEAVALSLGRDPSVVNWGSISKHKDRSEFVREYQRRLELLDRAQKIGKFGDHIVPSKFIVWARLCKLSLAEGVAESVSEYDEEAIDWRSKYEDLIKRSADVDAPRHSKQERSDAIIINCLAIGKFGFKPGRRNSAAVNIASCCFRAGYKIDEDTVRDRLAKANSIAKALNVADDTSQ